MVRKLDSFLNPGHVLVPHQVDHIKCIKKKFKQLTKAELVKCKAKR